MSGDGMRRRAWFAGAAFVALAVLPRNADAACAVTNTGTVNCNAGTTTTNTTNTDGGTPASSDRQQVFNNGAPINGTIQSGVTVGGFGLRLTEQSATAQPITMQNRGLVTTNYAVNSLQLDGNGGLITYSGDGSATNTNANGGALSVDNVSGSASVTTGAGAITGATGIKASTTGAGALTLTTGSGLVSGTDGPGILATTANGALNVTIGSGGVSSLGDNPAVNLTSTNGNITVTANGNVSANGIPINGVTDVHGIQAISNGVGNIVVDGSGTVFGQAGRGILTVQSTTGLGGILVSGTGDTISGTAKLGCCSGIRAEIQNPADSSNIIINRSGDVTAITTPSHPNVSGIHALTAGSGNIIVMGGVGATITNMSLFGINASAFGTASTGSINVSTGPDSILNAGGTGIFAGNAAAIVPTAAGSTIAVTNSGTINSGSVQNPVGLTVSGGTVASGDFPTALPAGILAGYTGVPVLGPSSGPYTSCGSFGCTTLAPNPNVNGTVNVVNSAAINAAGNGIFAFNFGNGNVSVTSSAPIIVTGATSQNGVEAFSAGVGNISIATMGPGTITTAGLNTTGGGSGIMAVNAATAIPAASQSTIMVSVGSAIMSGGNGVGNAGILAGYQGGATTAANNSVTGDVVVNVNAAVTSHSDGINAFNFGNGNVTVTTSAAGIVNASGTTDGGGIRATIDNAASSGNVNVTAHAAVNAATGDGISAANLGSGKASVTVSNNITAANGNGIRTSSAAGRTTINVNAGTTQGTASGISAASSGSGPIRINNASTIQNMSGLARDLAVATAGAGNAMLTNNVGAVVTGTVAMAGTGSNNFTNAGIWNTLGTSNFAGAGSVTNNGVISVHGPATFSGLTNLTSGGTLNLAVGGTVGTLTVTGNLAFQSSALYMVQVNPTTASLVNVTGTASLAGTASAVFAAGSYLTKAYTILHSAGLGGTAFGSLVTANLPTNFNASLSYTATDAVLNLFAVLGLGGLNINQQNVATNLNNFFNSGGTLPPNFVSVFGLTGSTLANALTQLDGEAATGAERGAFQLMDEFLGVMLDPFVYGRFGSGIGASGGSAIGFAPEELASLPPEVALAYAGVLKAPLPAPFVQRWTAWGASYGGSNETNGDAATGSSTLSAQTFGFAGGLDYQASPDTVAGFALGGGGLNWGLSGGLGGGRSDAFQGGVYGITRAGPAYFAGALAFTNHWIKTDRFAFAGDQLTATFAAQSYGARLEGGYRYAVLPTFGVTPYAALQPQDFHTPSYSETDLTGGGFGLSYAAMNTTDVRTELGSRFDALTLLAGMPLILRGRLAWAHDFVSNPSLDAIFQSLPGASFVVDGAPIPNDSALTSIGVQLYLTSRLSLIAKFDGEFAPGSQTYAGSGTLRYTW